MEKVDEINSNKNVLEWGIEKVHTNKDIEIHELIKWLSQLNFTKFESKFLKINRVIGSGGYAQVTHETYLANMPVAIKLLRDYYPTLIIRELLTLKGLSHTNLAKIYGFTVKVHNGSLSLGIVNEFINWYSLNDVMIPQVRSTILIHMVELADVVSYLHGVGLIHRDIKPDNILIDYKTKELKLIDFGISKFSHNSETITMLVGTHHYMAPEHFINESERITESSWDLSLISNKVDVFSFGVLLNYLFSEGEHPLKDLNFYEVLSFWLQGGKFTVSEKIEDPTIKNLIKSCVEIDVNARPTMIQVRNILIRCLIRYIDQIRFHPMGERESKILIFQNIII
jgi:serine/threonine protein kinase